MNNWQRKWSCMSWLNPCDMYRKKRLLHIRLRWNHSVHYKVHILKFKHRMNDEQSGKVHTWRNLPGIGLHFDKQEWYKYLGVPTPSMLDSRLNDPQISSLAYHSIAMQPNFRLKSKCSHLLPMCDQRLCYLPFGSEPWRQWSFPRSKHHMHCN